MRRIVSVKLQAAGPGAPSMDTYFDRVVKYIPSDIVAAWTAITGLITAAAGIPTATVLWIMFVVVLVITAVWTKIQTKVNGQPPAWAQVAISSGSFVVWVIALGGPFATIPGYKGLYGSLLLIVYTLVAAMFVPK